MAEDASVALRLAGVTVRHGPVTALDRFDLMVRPGERVGLIGPSGAGKTSVLNVVAGSSVPDGGSVMVFGRDLLALTGRALRGHRAGVGIVSQQLDLTLPLRVVHNVNAGRLGRWSTGAALWSLIRPSGRGEVVAALDQVGLADRVDSRTDELSGGERQRVAAARLLLQQPRLVLADEPTSSVDPNWSERVMTTLADLPGTDGAGLISAHDPALIRRHVDRLVGLRDGQTAFDRPAAEVDDNLIDQLYRDRHGTVDPSR